MENKRIFHYQDEKSDKFWIIYKNKTVCEINFGKLGNDGNIQKKEFTSIEEANKYFEKQINDKLKNGYLELTENEINKNNMFYDPILGIVKDEEFWWVIKKYVDIFGCITEININKEGYADGRKEYLTDYHRNTFNTFLKKEKSLKEKVIKSIFDFYIDEYEDHKDCFGHLDKEALNEILPELNSPKEIEKLITPKSILIQCEGNEYRGEVGLLYECEWENEHGLGICMKEWEILEVGTQDIVIQ